MRTIVHLVALGANAGINRAANAARVGRAMAQLSVMFRGRVHGSPLFATPAWPPGAGPEFINSVIAIRSSMSPAAMLRRLHDLEARLGRVRGRRWGERNLDLDLLACGQLVRPDDVTQTFWRHLPPARQQREAPDRLILPHPRLQDRAFVLVPLAHVAPRWRHPLTGRTVAAMAAALPASARAEVRRLGSARNPLVKR